jgi:predicted O-methyltransferase YrrM
VYSLYENVIGTEQQYYFFLNAEILRNELLQTETKIEKIELGTGNKKNKKIKISDIAKTALKSSKEAQLMFKLVNYFQPKNILEIGTSLGVTTSYIAAANSNANVVTIEGCPNTLAVAKSNFEKLRIKNITTHCGNFDEILPTVLSKFQTLDFVFFDGNHRYQPTINYFNLCLEKVNENSVFVFDDIHWSAEMTKAWDEIKNHKQVTVTIDLFSVGLVFFRTQQAKQHFILKF